ncbi:MULTISPECIES: pyridoxal 5'-phosphate synthase glutaminase subunit PdxT [Halobacteriaceae]|uniref:Pyridoxal 5'-phosphate synthase subunit PdxT n=1 Tax=Halanaeroarchaeum sulfurireducens TaxID=1604004 RepID=A0A0F7PGL8_9EURY|nr:MULTISPECIES: pyridoxal 5'-phosphate synthase glutaminase subunit PdxT [Halobacteriaceae]AKH98704.1 glutamine amidotransferase subunit PdxT [Halanaeroarchaeum sulfurireducens]MDR5657807.1 pyridoxal 5'-phosphate synthase glutaminase subunit PdxT [Halodesulfurarchaeum sp. HSR-GB]
MTLTAGVIALQGDVSEHVTAIEHAGSRHGETVEVLEVRESGQVPECDVLSMPGGESTAISQFIHREGIASEIVDHVNAGKPLLATCAGLILAAQDAQDSRVETLDLIEVSVDRNAFGRQKDSFETNLQIRGLDEPFPAVFIRAPSITEVGEGVEVLAEHDGRVVAVREPPVVGTAFHPELTGASQIHDLVFFESDLPPQ